MVNLSEAEEIRVPLRSVESSEREVSHRCRAALSFSQEDLLRVCQKRTCRTTRRREMMVLLASSSRALEMLAATLNRTQDDKLIFGAGDTSL